MFYVYVLRSKISNRLYTGSTQDLNRRLAEHNAGQSKSTRRGRPYTLEYYEVLSTRSEALKREKYLKTGKGREELAVILRGRSSAD